MIYKRDTSPHWLIEFTFRGKRYRKSSGTSNKAKAEAIERRWRKELEDLELLGKPREMTLGDALDRYRDTVIRTKGKPKAAQREEYALAVLKRGLGEKTRLLDIKAPTIADYRDKMTAEGKAPATVNRYLALLKATLRKAHMEWGALPAVPPIRLLKLNNARYRWLTEEEERCLLEVAAPHLRDLIVFLIDTGARRSEATGLTWRYVDLDRQGRGTVSFMDTKSGKPRTVPLTSRVRDMLAGWRTPATKPDDRVFLYRPMGRGDGVCKNPGTPRPFGFPYEPWKTALARAGLEDVHLHDLRHTFASRLVMRGVPLVTVSKLLGHASIHMTMRYSHLATNAYDEAISALEAA
ncbi:MAG: tyrosine-type recombinase/integrase [Magnetospirillum sp.]